MATDSIERLRYYQRQFLGALDFSDQQAYHRDMRRRHNLAHHTWGIVVGLELVEHKTETDEIEVWIRPGFAVDGYGRELILLRPQRLDPALFAAFADEDYRQVWLAYDEVRAGRVSEGYELCETNGEFARLRETTRPVIEPGAHTYDPPVVAGQQVDEPPLPNQGELRIPADLSVPYQELPVDEGRDWFVRLGSARWDGVNHKFLQPDPARLNEDRRYAGAVAEQLLAPDGRLVLRGRLNPSPLPSSASAKGYAGVAAEVEGTLEVDRKLTVHDDAQVDGDANVDGDLSVKGDAHALGKVGVGIVPGTRPLTIQALGQTEELISLADPTGAVKWHVNQNPGQASIGLQIVETGQPDNLLFLKAGGRLGVGTLTPRNALAVRGRDKAEELISFETAAGQTRWHLNQLLGGSKNGLNFAETNVADGRLFLRTGGNVGIQTTDPATALDVRGETRVQKLVVTDPTSGAPFTDNWLGMTDIVEASPTKWLHVGGIRDTDNVRRLALFADRAFISGNLGLGTTTPGEKLHVSGKLKLDGSMVLNGVELPPPVDVVCGMVVPPQTNPMFGPSGGSATNKFKFTVQSRIPKVSSAHWIVALSDIANTSTAIDPRWMVHPENPARTSDNSFEFTITWRVEDDGKIERIAWVVVFVA